MKTFLECLEESHWAEINLEERPVFDRDYPREFTEDGGWGTLRLFHEDEEGIYEHFITREAADEAVWDEEHQAWKVRATEDEDGDLDSEEEIFVRFLRMVPVLR